MAQEPKRPIRNNDSRPDNSNKVQNENASYQPTNESYRQANKCTTTSSILTTTRTTTNDNNNND